MTRHLAVPLKASDVFNDIQPLKNLLADSVMTAAHRSSVPKLCDGEKLIGDIYFFHDFRFSN